MVQLVPPPCVAAEAAAASAASGGGLGTSPSEPRAVILGMLSGASRLGTRRSHQSCRFCPLPKTPALPCASLPWRGPARLPPPLGLPGAPAPSAAAEGAGRLAGGDVAGLFVHCGRIPVRSRDAAALSSLLSEAAAMMEV